MADLQGNFVDAVAGFTLKGVVANLPTGTFKSSVWGPPSQSQGASALVANSLYVMAVSIPTPCTITGIQFATDTTTGTNVIVAMFAADGNTQLGVSASTAQSGAFTTQCVPFTAPASVAAGNFYLSLIPNNATGNFSCSGRIMSSSAIVAQGGFTMPTTITPPTQTARAGLSPVLFTY